MNCACGNDCEGSHDSRSFGSATCQHCGDDIDDFSAFQGATSCGCVSDLELNTARADNSPDFQPEWKVIFSYREGAFTEEQKDAFDALFWRLSDSLKSLEDGGAGSGFGCRDMDATFSDYDDADELLSNLQLLGKALGHDEDSLDFEVCIYETEEDDY